MSGHAGGGDGRGHERRDVELRVVVALGLGIAIFLTVATLASRLAFGYLAGRERALDAPPSALHDARPTPKGPRLQVAPRVDLESMRAEEDAILHSYGWIDREGGVVRIPIERAMELLAERGLPSPAPQAPVPEAGAKGERP